MTYDQEARKEAPWYPTSYQRDPLSPFYKWISFAKAEVNINGTAHLCPFVSFLSLCTMSVDLILGHVVGVVCFAHCVMSY